MIKIGNDDANDSKFGPSNAALLSRNGIVPLNDGRLGIKMINP